MNINFNHFDFQKIAVNVKPILKPIWAAGSKPRINYDITVASNATKWAPGLKTKSKSISGVSKSQLS